MYSLINVSGLPLGFTCCLLIYLFTSDELSYDKFHKDAHRIYRVSSPYMRQGVWEPYASNSWRTAELIRNNYNEVEQFVRIQPDNNEIFEYSDKRILETPIGWVDDIFFSVFSFPLVMGNPEQALKGPNKVVISKTIAFLLATVFAAIILVSTTGFRALKAALANPIDSLRAE